MVNNGHDLTPEVAAYWQTKERTESVLHSMTRRILIVAVSFVLLLTALTVVFYTSEYNTTQANHADITHLEAKISCQNQAFNKILKDVRLAFANDKSPADYAKAVTKC